MPLGKNTEHVPLLKCNLGAIYPTFSDADFFWPCICQGNPPAMKRGNFKILPLNSMIFPANELNLHFARGLSSQPSLMSPEGINHIPLIFQKYLTNRNSYSMNVPLYSQVVKAIESMP